MKQELLARVGVEPEVAEPETTEPQTEPEAEAEDKTEDQPLDHRQYTF